MRSPPSPYGGAVPSRDHDHALTLAHEAHLDHGSQQTLLRRREQMFYRDAAGGASMSQDPVFGSPGPKERSRRSTSANRGRNRRAPSPVDPPLANLDRAVAERTADDILTAIGVAHHPHTTASVPDRPHHARHPKIRPPIGDVVRLSEVAPEPVRWLSPGRLGIGKVTVLDGDPGFGKSTLLCELAARVTRGDPFPVAGPPPRVASSCSRRKTASSTPFGPASTPLAATPPASSPSSRFPAAPTLHAPSPFLATPHSWPPTPSMQMPPWSSSIPWPDFLARVTASTTPATCVASSPPYARSPSSPTSRLWSFAT